MNSISSLDDELKVASSIMRNRTDAEMSEYNKRIYGMVEAFYSEIYSFIKKTIDQIKDNDVNYAGRHYPFDNDVYKQRVLMAINKRLISDNFITSHENEDYVWKKESLTINYKSNGLLLITIN